MVENLGNETRATPVSPCYLFLFLALSLCEPPSVTLLPLAMEITSVVASASENRFPRFHILRLLLPDRLSL